MRSKVGTLWEYEALSRLQSAGVALISNVSRQAIADVFSLQHVSPIGNEEVFGDLNGQLLLGLLGSTTSFSEFLKRWRNPLVQSAVLREGSSSSAESNDRIVFHIYQTVWQPQQFGSFSFRAFKPDLLLVRAERDAVGSIRWDVSVVDMKSAASIQPSHKVQLATYVTLLRAVFQQQEFRDRVHVSDEMYVWCIDAPWYSPVSKEEAAASLVLVKDLLSLEGSIPTTASLPNSLPLRYDVTLVLF